MPRSDSAVFVPQLLGVLVAAGALLEALLPASSAVGWDGACQVCPAMGQILFLSCRRSQGSQVTGSSLGRARFQPGSWLW